MAGHRECSAWQNNDLKGRRVLFPPFPGAPECEHPGVAEGVFRVESRAVPLSPVTGHRVPCVTALEGPMPGRGGFTRSLRERCEAEGPGGE